MLRVNKTKIMAVLICSALILTEITNISFAFFGYYGLNDQLLVPVIRLQGILPVFAIIGLAIFSKFSIAIKTKTDKATIFYLAFAFFYFAIFSALNGLVRGNDLTYLIGDSYRSSLIFLALLALALGLYSSEIKSESSFLWLIPAFIVFALVGIIFKIYFLLVLEIYYGGGINQFYLGNFLLSYLLLLIARQTARINYQKWMTLIFLTIGIVLSLLSFKRGVWLSILLVFSFVYSFNVLVKIHKKRFQKSLILSISIMALFGVIVLPSSPALDTFESRFERGARSFEAGFDDFESQPDSRFLEIVSTVETLAAAGNPLNWVVGYGSGAEYQLLPDGYTEHHVHSMPFLILFRHGLLGLLIYLPLLVLPIFYYFKYQSVAHANPRATESQTFLVGLSLTVELLVNTLLSAQGNAYYGNFYLAIALFVARNNLEFIKKSSRR